MRQQMEAAYCDLEGFSSIILAGIKTFHSAPVCFQTSKAVVGITLASFNVRLLANDTITINNLDLAVGVNDVPSGGAQSGCDRCADW